MRAVIVGGTGLIGGCVINEILGDKNWTQLISIGRRTQVPKTEKWTERVGPMTDLDSLCRGVEGDAAFCCLGTTIKKAASEKSFVEIDRNLPLYFAKLMLKNGIRNFHVISSLGADAKSGNLYLRTKGQMEEGLRGLGFHSLTIYRPSLLLGKREESRPLERLSMSIYGMIRPIYPQFLQTWQPIAASEVARIMVRQSLTPIKGTRIIENKDMHSNDFSPAQERLENEDV